MQIFRSLPALFFIILITMSGLPLDAAAQTGRDPITPRDLWAMGSVWASAISPWLDPDDALYVATIRPRVVFATYDWGLGCSAA